MSVSQKTCADGVAKYIELADQYNKDLDDYKKKVELRDKEQKRLDDWGKKIGEFAWIKRKQEELENEKRTWQECTSSIWGGFVDHDASCAWAQGDGWVGAIVDGKWAFSCDSFGGMKAYCKRTPAKAESDANDITGYNTIKPLIPLAPPMPLPPSGDITCCGIDISKLTAGNNINISNIKQECGKKINPTTSDPTTSDPKSTIIEFITTNIRIIILVISIIIALILISF